MTNTAGCASSVRFTWSRCWIDVVPVMVQNLVLESLDNTGKVDVLGREVVGVRADLALLTHIREFQAEYDTAGAPQVRGFRLEGYGVFFDVDVPGGVRFAGECASANDGGLGRDTVNGGAGKDTLSNGEAGEGRTARGQFVAPGVEEPGAESLQEPGAAVGVGTAADAQDDLSASGVERCAIPLPGAAGLHLTVSNRRTTAFTAVRAPAGPRRWWGRGPEAGRQARARVVSRAPSTRPVLPVTRSSTSPWTGRRSSRRVWSTRRTGSRSARWLSRCRTRMPSLPFLPNSGQYAVTGAERVDQRRLPRAG